MEKLELKNVSKVFEKIDEDEKTHALKNINLSMKNNEFVSIVGPLFPWLSVGENVGFSGSLKNEEKIDEKEIDLMLKKVGLGEFKNSYPKELSGGMAQRVSLIRTMISKPEIFLLDEPLGSLDAFTRMNMQDEILNLWQEIKNLMIMVTHDVEEAVYMSTKIIIMEPRPGRIKEVVDINLDYPRDRTSQKFIEYRNKILKILNY